MVRHLRISPRTDDRDFGPAKPGGGPAHGTGIALVHPERLPGSHASPEQTPEILLIDIAKPGDVSAAARDVARDRPGIKTISLSFPDGERHVARVLAAAAKTYLPSGATGFDILNAITAFSRGASYVMVGIPMQMLTEAAKPQLSVVAQSSPARLTLREVEILTGVSRGFTNKEIARELSLSEKTVKNSMTQIMQKLKVRNRVEAVLTIQKAKNILPGE